MPYILPLLMKWSYGKLKIFSPQAINTKWLTKDMLPIIFKLLSLTKEDNNSYLFGRNGADHFHQKAKSNFLPLYAACIL